jgi:autotransporter-associated beta strand protein
MSVADWRAIATFSPVSTQPVTGVLPRSFFKGQRSFTKSVSETYERLETANNLGASIGTALKSTPTARVANLASVVASDTIQTTGTPTTEVQESDIWKVSGNTVFFFNQLRGLQVIDVTDKANPRLKANFRLAESGEDMFVRDTENPDEKNIILLTRTPDSKTQAVSLRYSGNTLTETGRFTADGWLNDSRIAGNQLYLVNTTWAYYNQTEQNTDRTTLHQVEIDPTGGLTEKQSFDVLAQAGSAIVSSAPGWITVASSNYTDWNTSSIEVFSVSDNGAAKLTTTPIKTNGRVRNKFNVNFDNQYLSVVTERWQEVAVATLENFTLDGTQASSLEIISGEMLFATRFHKNTLYAVTFQQVDPLWVIDISDKSDPKIAGHLEVPGYSTYIEPIGDFLFSIGLEEGKIAASLFDVRDPANPTLADRAYLDQRWAWSEALYNEKALKVLPDQGLALIPFSGSTSALQLLDISTESIGKLTLRGKLENTTASRRATVVDKTLISITQEQLVTADITNRDLPAIQAEVLLAWPVDRVAVSGDYLLQIATGNAWSAQTPSIKISRVSDENTILQEIELNAGTITDISVNGNRLAVLRRVPVANQDSNIAYPDAGLVRIAACIAYVPYLGGLGNMVLDVYDLSTLPNLNKPASVQVDLSTDAWWETSSLNWLTPTLVGTVVQRTAAADNAIRPMIMPMVMRSATTAVSSTSPRVAKPGLIRPLPSRSPKNTSLQVFDVSSLTAPTALAPLEVATSAHTKINVTAAGDGLFVLGFGRASETIKLPRPFADVPPAYDLVTNKISIYRPPQQGMFRYTHNLAVIDFTNPAKPTKNESIDLPGRLFGFGVIQKTGFIAYSESCTPDAAGNISREVQATAIDGKDGYLIANLTVSRGSRLASLGSDLFVSTDGVLTPYRLTEGGGFTALAPVTLSSQPDALRPLGGALFASQGLRFSRVSWPSEGPTVETASLGYSANVNHLAIAADGTVVVPSGPYGVLRIFGPNSNLAGQGLISIANPNLSGTLLITNPNAGIATGAGLVKTGSELTTSANVSLTATNTFTGTTTVSGGGTLTLSGSSGGTSTLVSTTNNTSAASSPANGTLVLSGSSTLSGVTTVTNGTLILSGTVSGITPVLTQPVIIGDAGALNTGTVSFSGTPSN